jgi:hypothetical protein
VLPACGVSKQREPARAAPKLRQITRRCMHFA